MSVSVCVIIVGQAARLIETVDSVLTQTRSASEVLLVEDPIDPVTQTTRALLVTNGVTIVAAPPAATPGRRRNVGVMASRSEWMVLLDPDDLLLPSFLAETLATASSTSASFVTTGSLISGGTSIQPPAGTLTLEQVAARPECIHPASLLSREAWQAVGGFDETLPARVAHDFWLRLLEAGRTGAAVERPLLIARSSGACAKANCETADHMALQSLVDKHRPAFASYLPSIVCGRDRFLEELRSTRQRMNVARLQTDTQLEQVKTHVDAVTASLLQAGRARIEFGDFSRPSPIVGDAETALHRHFIEQFIETHAGDIRGRVLEVHDQGYTARYGGAVVTSSIAIDNKATNSAGTLLDALHARNVTPSSCDCVIMPHSLHLVYDVRAVLQQVARATAAGGVVLATFPCTSGISPERPHGDFWRFTAAAVRRLFGEFFPADKLDVSSYGNVLVNIASLYGLERDDLAREEYEADDPFFPLMIGVRARV
jgi:hypothetical protein